jgi:hypothetical protein
MLTATLPLSEENKLFRRMHFKQNQVKIFQARTTRSNMAYRVIGIDKALKKQEVEAVIVNKARQKIR